MPLVLTKETRVRYLIDLPVLVYAVNNLMPELYTHLIGNCI